MINYDGLYKKDYYGDKLFENHFSAKKLRFKIFENATILPHKPVAGTVGFGGIVDSKGNFIEESFVHHGIKEVYTPSEEIYTNNTAVIYLGMFVHIWGHCLTDSLKRIWFLQSDIYKTYFSKLPLVYVPMWMGIIKPFAKILEILEVDVNRLIPITKPQKFNQIILPDESIFDIQGGAWVFSRIFGNNFADKKFRSEKFFAT